MIIQKGIACLNFISVQGKCQERNETDQNHYPSRLAFPKQALVFMCLQYESFENTMGKEEIACNSDDKILDLSKLKLSADEICFGISRTVFEKDKLLN